MTHTLKLRSGSIVNVRLDALHRDKIDKRDFVLRSLTGAVKKLDSEVDNSSSCPPIDDQSQLGSCTSHMAVGMIEYNDIKWGSRAGWTRASRLFQYYATRKLEHTTKTDSGASIRDAVKAASKFGIAPESLWQYDITKFAKRPPTSVWTVAAQKKITAYHRIQDGDIATMKSVLASGYLVGFGFTVYDNMMTQKMADEGWLHLPAAGESVQGGHAVVLVGYSDSRRAFKVRNSWGSGWGQDGYFWMDYDYVANRQLANDFWVIDSAVEI